jgi:hypothetical protein
MTTATRPKAERPESSAPLSTTGSGVRRSVTPPPISQPLTPFLIGASFLEGVVTKRLVRDNFNGWIEQNLIATGYLLGVLRIHEPIFGALPTDKGCSPFLPETPPADEIAALLVRARARVIGHLQGLLRVPAEDRFISTAIYSRRVRRSSVGGIGGSMSWIPHPRHDDNVSDIIMSLFVADILGRREFYEQNLCICQRCGRIRFDSGVDVDRQRCFFC